MDTMRGLFLSFEGTDGCGKSTQMSLLGSYLEGRNFEIVATREPGGTSIGEQVRDILLDRGNSSMNPHTEALLYAAARAQHVREVLLPAIDRGAIVLCDRYIDSSIAYQGYGRGLGLETVLRLNETALGGLMPDRTFFLDVEPDKAFNRRRVKGRRDRMEDAEDAFFERLYSGYVTLCDMYPTRMQRVDASGGKEQTQKQLRDAVDALLIEKGLVNAQDS